MTRDRLVCVDVLRSVAIALALFQHGLSTFAVWPAFDAVTRAMVRVTANVATPAFVLIFGIVLELVYVPLVAREGLAGIRRRLWRRAGVCYLAYLLTIVAAVGSGRRSLVDGWAAAAFLGDTRYGNILKFYALALPLGSLLVGARVRWGVRAVVGGSVAVWLALPVLDLMPWPVAGSPLAHLTATVVGRPARSAWLSLLHSVPWIAVGMLIGHHATGAPVMLRRTIARVLGASAVAVAMLVAQRGGHALLVGYLSVRLRAAHDVAYYVLGLFEAVLFLFVLANLWPGGVTSARWRVPLALGQGSLLAFTVGCCALNAWPPAWRVAPGVGLLLSAGLPVLALAVVLAREGAAASGRRVHVP